ncbi:MAG: HEAT repeat domain-containing protein, partial [Myxococcota bacterium]|nr:HEAT repeat domain-containing protein [Myxococcota bacterium]
MLPVVVAMSLSLLVATPTPRDVRQALNVVSACDNLKSTRCLRAASTLERGGDRVFKLITPRFSKMSPLGQMLALSVYGGHPGHEATMGLAKLVLKAKLAPAIRSVAIQTLADRFDGRRTRRLVTATLIKVAKDKETVVRAAAIRALGNRATTGDRHVITILRRAATDESAPVRTEAILGLGLTGHTSAAPLLIAALEDKIL